MSSTRKIIQVLALLVVVCLLLGGAWKTASASVTESNQGQQITKLSSSDCNDANDSSDSSDDSEDSDEGTDDSFHQITLVFIQGWHNAFRIIDSILLVWLPSAIRVETSSYLLDLCIEFTFNNITSLCVVSVSL